MGVEKNIIMKQFNGTDYDILYPKTTADQIENVYTENQILSSGTTGKYQLPAGSLPDAVFNKLLEAMPWTLIQEYKTAGAYTWTAPDLYNGASYKIGVYMVGGGGSGAAGRRSSSSGNETFGSGGASGYAKNLILTVTPAQQIACVVGAGGVFSDSFRSGNGGSTSFNNIVVSGGNGGDGPTQGSAYGADGGQGSDGGSRNYTSTPDKIYGSCNTKGALIINSSGFASAVGSGGRSQSPRESQNWFDTTMVTLCAGGYAGQIIEPMPDGTKGGNGIYSSGTEIVHGENATGNGNGGGAAFSASTSSGTVGAVGGSGSDGMILIYARAI